MTIVNAPCHSPAIRDTCTHLCRRGQPGKGVLAAIMRKLLPIPNAMFRDPIPRRKNHACGGRGVAFNATAERLHTGFAAAETLQKQRPVLDVRGVRTRYPTLRTYGAVRC